MKTTYRGYLLGVLSLILAFNYIDRWALSLALQSIKLDLHIGDTQLGLLSGIAFAFFFSVVGIPIGRWADRGNRVRILWLTRIIWGVMVSLCGLVTGFWQLLLVRAGVAIGEAGCAPPSNSLIPEYYARAERPRAMGLYLIGGSLSSVVGYFGGGWLIQLLGWRRMFMILGLPGLVLAALTAFTLQEPRAWKVIRAEAGADPRPEAHPSLSDVFRKLWGIVSFRHLLVAFALASFFSFGASAWLPAFFIRSYRLNVAQLGGLFSIVYGVPSVLGLYLGGEWATRWAPNEERLQLRVIAAVELAFAAMWAVAFFTHSLWLALSAIAAATLGANLAVPPMYGTIQTLVPPRMRAISIALVYLATNLIGLGFGPLAAGALSDALHAHFGADSLRYALLILDPGYFWAAAHVWQASRHVMRDLQAARSECAVDDAPALRA